MFKGLVNVRIKQHPTIGGIISTKYFFRWSVMFRIPKTWTFTVDFPINTLHFKGISHRFPTIIDHFSRSAKTCPPFQMIFPQSYMFFHVHLKFPWISRDFSTFSHKFPLETIHFPHLMGQGTRPPAAPAALRTTSWVAESHTGGSVGPDVAGKSWGSWWDIYRMNMDVLHVYTLCTFMDLKLFWSDLMWFHIDVHWFCMISWRTYKSQVLLGFWKREFIWERFCWYQKNKK